MTKKVQAMKYDGEKPRFALIPVRAKEEVAKVFTYGAVKYTAGNWHSGDGFDYDRLISASERHGSAISRGEDIDPESGLYHAAHKIACDMMLLEYTLTKHGKDNRSIVQYLPEHTPITDNSGGPHGLKKGVTYSLVKVSKRNSHAVRKTKGTSTSRNKYRPRGAKKTSKRARRR